MPRKKVVKDTTVQETPVVFFLRISEQTSDEILPAGTEIAYTEIVKPTASTSYAEILRSVETSVSLNSEMLKGILDKTIHTEYSQDTSCFWCCHGFHWSPCVLPISYDAYKNMYSCEGHFCSPECALAYLYKEGSTESTKWNRHSLLRHMYSKLYTTKDLSPAPPRTLLRMFGGPLDIEQYRTYTMKTNDLIASELPPIRLVFPTMNIQGPIRDIKKYVSLSTDVIEKASEQLRLKRSKPVHANIPTIDMVLRMR
jgi:hypothetical protein